jgi:hypothetical protein
VSARPIGWAALDEEAREGIDGKVDKAELPRRRSWSLVKRLGWNAKGVDLQLLECDPDGTY